jgi:hypothetical protein
MDRPSRPARSWRNDARSTARARPACARSCRAQRRRPALSLRSARTTTSDNPTGCRLGHDQAWSIRAVRSLLDGRGGHRARCGCAPTLCSLPRLPAFAAPRHHRLGVDARARRIPLRIHPSELAAPALDVPCRSRLGGAACAQHPATAHVGHRSRLGSRRPAVLRDPAPRSEPAREGAGRTRSPATTDQPPRRAASVPARYRVAVATYIAGAATLTPSSRGFSAARVIMVAQRPDFRRLSQVEVERV